VTKKTLVEGNRRIDLKNQKIRKGKLIARNLTSGIEIHLF
jgi:hypothetical protein